MKEKIDILIFGAHPDDVELGCSGTIMKHLDLGYKIGIIDLTKGELGTRGNEKIRKDESQKALSLMNVSFDSSYTKLSTWPLVALQPKV